MTAEPLRRWHVGPWTARASLPGEPRQPGRRRTPDELNFDVIGLARILGRRWSVREESLVRLWQNELRPTHTRRCGVHTLADPRQLAATAREAFGWLAERAPAGYRFVLTDAVYLEPVLDPGPGLETGPVAIDAVIRLAAERVADLPSARLAACRVRRCAGGWVADDGVCRWAGPYTTDRAAVAAVARARSRLAGELRAAGCQNLADSAPRWLPVPVEPGLQVATK